MGQCQCEINIPEHKKVHKINKNNNHLYLFIKLYPISVGVSLNLAPVVNPSHIYNMHHTYNMYCIKHI